MEGLNGEAAERRLKWIVSRILLRLLKEAAAIIHLASRLLARSSDLTRGLRADHPTLLFGLAPGGVCLASDIAAGPVSSYLAFSPLPTALNGWRYFFCGTFPRLLGAAVSGHPVLRSPDFPLSALG